MGPRARSPIVLLALAGSLLGGIARAQDAPSLVDYCAEGGSEASAARDAVRALGDAIEDPSVPLAAIEQRYRALVATPCFALASHFAPRFRSRAVLRVWWEEGGEDWLHHFANGHTAGSALEVVIPPEERPALSLEASPPDHPLRSLLCSETDEACGRETAGWTLRAQAAFDAHAARERVSECERSERAIAEGDVEWAAHATEASRFDSCAREASRAPTLERFPRWRACISGMRDHVSALPVGRIRAPTRGWLVLRGRRGHYQFCDEIRAYDLATGSAYIATSCSALVLGSGGTVQGAATDAARTSRVVTGRLPLEALREAAWMLLLGTEVDRSHMTARYVPLPIDMPTRHRADYLGSVGHGSGSGSSAQTHLQWAWVDEGRVRVDGTLTWPDSDAAAEDHAASLFRIAEAALALGCAPTPIPRGLPLGDDAGGVSALDADADSLRRAADALEGSLRAARAPRCHR
ncbi:MAG: hypothetical protein OHK0013_22220 [Sandaracinaceae bacterium]